MFVFFSIFFCNGTILWNGAASVVPGPAGAALQAHEVRRGGVGVVGVGVGSLLRRHGRPLESRSLPQPVGAGQVLFTESLPCQIWLSHSDLRRCRVSSSTTSSSSSSLASGMLKRSTLKIKSKGKTQTVTLDDFHFSR